ncbi:MAG: family 43 glycosylhydrolase, partial [Rufibacter sp.]
PYPVSATGHADLVQTQNGDWWAVFLATRPYDGVQDYYNTGRETFLAPVTWKEGWPVINADQELVQYAYQKPNLPAQPKPTFPLSGNFTVQEDFDGSKLPMHWLQLRTPRNSWYRLSGGKLEIEVRPESFSEKVNPSFLARRQQHVKGSASTKLEFTPTGEKEFAGLVAFQNDEFYYALGKSKKGNSMVVQLRKPDGTVLGEKVLSNQEAKKPLWLKVEFDGATYAFYYGTEKDKWQLLQDKVDGTFLSTRTAGGFVGAVLGMYATSNGQSSKNKATFDWFRYQGNDAIFANPALPNKP